MEDGKVSLDVLNKKQEARKICKTILEFGVTDDQKIEIMSNLALSLENNEIMKDVVNFLKKFGRNFNEEENNINIDKDNNKNKILLN
tara:strand:- start:1057 stop:1317 length:261 start_codon:yes stop_codon:yes gene_type:complete